MWPERFGERGRRLGALDRKSTRLNSSHVEISYAVFCLKKKKKYNKLHSSNIKHCYNSQQLMPPSILKHHDYPTSVLTTLRTHVVINGSCSLYSLTLIIQ